MELKEGYEQTEVGVIPSDWNLNELAKIGQLSKGRGLLKHEIFPSGSIPAIPYTAIYTDFNEVLDYEKIKWFVENANSSVVLSNPCVLIASSSNMDANTGKATAIKGGIPVAVGREVIIFQTPHNASFISYLLSTSLYRKKTLALARGTTIKHVYPATFRNYKICVPSYAEQNAIAEALSDADALIESLDQLIVKKRQIKQGTMQELLTGKRRLPGFSGEWEEIRLGKMADMGSGGTPPSSNPDFYDGEIPWVAISDMTKGGKYISSTERNLSNEGFSNCAAQIFTIGTVLYAMYASLGECSIATVSLSSSQAILGIRAKPKLNSEFLYYFLQSIKSQVKTMGQQGTQANLNKKMVQEFDLHLPPLIEQTAIATLLSDMDTELAALESRLAKARQIKQGMMQELLTGRIRLL